MQATRCWVVLGVLVSAVSISACGKGGGGGTPAPSPVPSPGGATVTLTSSGVSPREVTVSVGSRVTFQNNDNAPHDMDSDPHPDHTDCPEINVGFIAAGQNRQTQNLNTARVCTYHDHNQPTNVSLHGTIRIQ